MAKYLNYLFFHLNKRNLVGYRPQSGRNFQGVICVRHKSGGNKKKYCFIDFYRRVHDYGYVYKILASPNHTGYIGGVVYQNGLFSYILLSEATKVGSRLYLGSRLDDLANPIGATLTLRHIRLFSLVSNIEKYPFSGGALARSAGSSAILTSKLRGHVTIKLKSGWNLRLSEHCVASVGNVSNMKHRFDIKKKAGVVRAKGVRPSVRGVAMNPCDHPHGGGEGKKSPPSGQRSPWGWLTKGTPSLKKAYQKEKKKLYKKL